MNSDVTQDMQRFEHQLEMASLESESAESEGLAAVLESDELVDRDEMNQLLGQIQMSRALSDFANVVTISKLKTIRETKQYQSLKGVKAFDRDGKLIANVGTWDGFCRALGISRQKAEEDLKNLETFGTEALERLSGLGIGYREMRQLRKLPEEAREAVINGDVVNVGDKEEVVELIESMAAKHAREKQALADKVEKLESDRQVDQRLLGDKEKKINELERELARDLTPDQAAKKRAERDELLKSELMDKALSSISMLNELASVTEKILDLDDRTEHLEETLYAELRGIFRHALLLGRQYDILPEQLLGLPVADLATFDRVLEGELM